MDCHDNVALPPQLERFLLRISLKSGSAGPTRFSEMLIKILLLTILVGSIAVSPHIPAWADLAKRKGS
jgi:hypothetical protein